MKSKINRNKFRPLLHLPTHGSCKNSMNFIKKKSYLDMAIML